MNPRMPEQPYAYYADPEEPAIPVEDWNMEHEDQGNKTTFGMMRADPLESVLPHDPNVDQYPHPQ